MDDLIYLVAQTYTQDAINQPVAQETLRPVWAHLQSASRSEWAQAGQRGLQPQLVAVTPAVNYEGETVVQLGDGEKAVRYGVYRTYFAPDGDAVELYLEKKAGV